MCSEKDLILFFSKNYIAMMYLNEYIHPYFLLFLFFKHRRCNLNRFKIRPCRHQNCYITQLSPQLNLCKKCGWIWGQNLDFRVSIDLRKVDDGGSGFHFKGAWFQFLSKIIFFLRLIMFTMHQQGNSNSQPRHECQSPCHKRDKGLTIPCHVNKALLTVRMLK